jgi:hypothetical protein
MGQLQRRRKGIIGQLQDLHQLVLRQPASFFKDLLAGGFQNLVPGRCRICLNRH